MFWTFAAGAYSQYKAGKVAGAVYKAVKAASNFKPPVRVPIVPPSVPSVPTLVMEYDTIVKKDIRAHYDSAACRTVYDTVEHIVVLPVGVRSEKQIRWRSMSRQKWAMIHPAPCPPPRPSILPRKVKPFPCSKMTCRLGAGF